MSAINQVVDEVRALEAQFKNGQITAGELKELLEDIQHTRAIEAAAGSLDAKEGLNKLINGIIAAAGAI